MKLPVNDCELLDFVQRNHAWLTYASELALTDRAWRCYVAPARFFSPDVRECKERVGYGRTARAAIKNAMK